MLIELTHKFQKQVISCSDPRIKSRIYDIIQQVEACDNMNGFPNLKKLAGYKNVYRIRLRNYRIGILIDIKTVTFAAFDHRSDIYKYFP
jgi:mRNA interferase RelE/StbE